MMCSSSAWGTICDKFGRRKGLILAVAWTSYMGLLSAFSPNYPWIFSLNGNRRKNKSFRENEKNK